MPARMRVISSSANGDWQDITSFLSDGFSNVRVVRIEITCDQNFEFRNSEEEAKVVTYDANSFFSIDESRGGTSLEGLQVKAASGTFSGEYQY